MIVHNSTMGAVRLGCLVVNLSEKTLDHLTVGATASPEVYVDPYLAPEKHTALHQGLHNVELTTLQKLCCHHAEHRRNLTCSYEVWSGSNKNRTYRLSSIVMADGIQNNENQGRLTVSASITIGLI